MGSHPELYGNHSFSTSDDGICTDEGNFICGSGIYFTCKTAVYAVENHYITVLTLQVPESKVATVRTETGSDMLKIRR